MNAITLLHKWRLIQAVAADRDLSAGATKVMLRLLYHHNAQTGQCSPSYATLANGAGLKRRQTIYAVQELEARGWITLTRVKGGNPKASGGLVTNTFGFDFERVEGAPPVHSSALPPGAPECTPTSAPECTTPVHSSAPLPVHQSAPKTEKQSGKGNREPPIVPTAFDEFWNAYPRKVSKDAARKAYDRAIKAGRATAADLTAGATRYAAERKGEDSTFTKHPATWLNAGCWADEPAPKRATVARNSGRGFSALAYVAGEPDDDA